MPQPIVQRQLATVETRKVMLGCQRNGGRKSRFGALRLVFYFCNAGARRSSDLSFGPGAGGLSSECMKAS